jgi:FlaA1/EpsC-like NDP-sugar epimerase
VFARHRPQVVFHAAAHKHVPTMESNRAEAVRNNVLGTRTVALAADRHRTERFVMISTDKAVNPTSMVGVTKRVAEFVVQDLGGRSETAFVTVRFGNVLGSNGSVVPGFLEQIEAGGPVTVTHPEMRRSFARIPEAVALVLHAASQAEGGDLVVLQMGDQIRVTDMARNLIRLSGYVPDRDIEIQFVGLRPGEKLYEELVGADEIAEPHPSQKLMRVRPRSIPADLDRRVLELGRAATLGATTGLVEQLLSLVPTFRPESAPAPHRAEATPRPFRPEQTPLPYYPEPAPLPAAAIDLTQAAVLVASPGRPA